MKYPRLSLQYPSNWKMAPLWTSPLRISSEFAVRYLLVFTYVLFRKLIHRRQLLLHRGLMGSFAPNFGAKSPQSLYLGIAAKNNFGLNIFQIIMIQHEVGFVHKQVTRDILSYKRPLGCFKKRIEPHLDRGHSVFSYSDCSSLLSLDLTTLGLTV
jgi:hypothetical protein